MRREDNPERRGITSKVQQIQRLRMQETRKDKRRGRETQRKPANRLAIVDWTIFTE